MALSAGSIDKLLAQHLKHTKSRKGTKGLAGMDVSGVTNLNDMRRRTGIVGETSEEQEEEITRYAEQMKMRLYNAIHAVIESFPESAIRYEIIPGTPAYAVFSFDKDALWRDSLCQDYKTASKWDRRNSKHVMTVSKSKIGIHNIVLLFEKGWSASGSIRGEYHGKMVWSRRARHGEYMLYKAMKAFNRESPDNVQAVLLNEYK